MTMSILYAEAFLNDANPEVRKAAIRTLIVEDDPRAEKLIAGAMADRNPAVWKTARNALLSRNPWLLLEPFKVRPVPEALLDSPSGRSWQYLREGIAKCIQSRNHDFGSGWIDRWKDCPGVIPDVSEILRSIGEAEKAKELESITKSARRQILISPTYRCNISCEYCYAKNWAADFGPEMSLERLDAAFSWMAAQEINYVILCGGEPTVYTHLAELLSKAKEHEMGIMLTTNGVYSPAVQELIHKDNITEFIAHYDQGIMSTKKTIALRFKYNLIKAKEHGVDPFLRYTLTNESNAEEWGKLILLAKELGITRINYGFAFKNISGNNSYFDYQLGRQDNQFENIFTSFISDCNEESIKVHQSKPFPLCLLSKDTLRDAAFNGFIRTSCIAHLRGYTHNLTINPDLSTFPCNAVGIAGPKITDFSSLADAGHHYEELLQSLQHTPYFDACEQCILFYRGFCQGVCLAQHAQQSIKGIE